MAKDYQRLLKKLQKELKKEGIVILPNEWDQSEEWLSLVSVAGCYSSACCNTSQRMK